MHIIVTRHALDRGSQVGLVRDDIIRAMLQSRRVAISTGRSWYKFLKYSMRDGESVNYYFFAPLQLLLTVADKAYTHIIITVTHIGPGQQRKLRFAT